MKALKKSNRGESVAGVGNEQTSLANSTITNSDTLYES